MNWSRPAVVALLALVMALVPLSSAGADDASFAEEHMAAETHRFLNDERAERGLPPLQYHPELAARAQEWAEEMSATGYRHSDSDFYADLGLITWENINQIRRDHGPGQTNLEWMESEGHRTARLGQMELYGVGFYCDPDGFTSVVEVMAIRQYDTGVEYRPDRPADPIVHGDADSTVFCDSDHDAPPVFSPVAEDPPAGEPEPVPHEEPVAVMWERRAGVDRYETAAANADIVPNRVVIASGENWPDAVSAAGVAGDRGIVLLVGRDHLPESTERVLRVTPPGAEVFVMGGPAAVSDSVYLAVRAAAPDSPIARIAGADRTLTAVAAASLDVYAEQVVIADAGEPFSALLAGSSRRGPLLLAANGRLPAEAWEFLAGNETIWAATLFGAANDDTLAAELEAAGIVAHSGPDGVEADPDGVSAEYASETRLSAPYVVIASGESWPDTLTGAVLAARERRPLLFAMPDGSTDWSVLGRLSTEEAVVIGGPAALSDEALPARA